MLRESLPRAGLFAGDSSLRMFPVTFIVGDGGVVHRVVAVMEPRLLSGDGAGLLPSRRRFYSGTDAFADFAVLR